jgi:hypothetical protein
MEDVGIFYGHLVHFTVFCYILLTFGIVRGNLVYCSRFGILYKEKSGNPDRLASNLLRNRPLKLSHAGFVLLGQKLVRGDRVSRFFLVHDTKTGKNVPNEYKMYQMVIKYTQSP